MPVRRGKSAKQKSRKVLQEERSVKVVELALQGLKHGEIAKQLGVSTMTIHSDFKRMLAEAAEARRAYGDLLLEEHLTRLEAKITQLDDRMEQSSEYDDRLYSQWLRYMSERARLLDLYPKQTTQVTDNRQQVFVLQWDGGRTSAGNGDNTIEGNARPLLADDPDDGDNVE